MARRFERLPDEERIEQLVKHYTQFIQVFKMHLEQLVSLFQSAPELQDIIHSVKGRVKDPEHLREKLRRKFEKIRKSGAVPIYSKANLFLLVSDLAGARILHLHTSQFKALDKALREVLETRFYRIVEPVEAKTWDDEYRKYFCSLNISTTATENLYTSVHYTIALNSQKFQGFAEVQVRTLAEELWGEVDHKINYPEKHQSLGCREQIAVLARVASSCTRLVDSIFVEHEADLARKAASVPKRRATSGMLSKKAYKTKKRRPKK